MVRLVKASLEAPAGLQELLEQLGDGENGFVGTGQMPNTQSLATYLRSLVDMDLGIILRPGWVPMTTHWLLDDAGVVAGVSRLRHRLTPELLNDGGNIGYYIRPAYRGKGHGKTILALTLIEARKLGLERVLLTVRIGNQPSIRVIETNNGILEDERTDPEGFPYRRYWIDLTGGG